MFCGNCGAQMSESDQFCPNCGQPRDMADSTENWQGNAPAPGANPSIDGGGRTWILDPEETGGGAGGWDDDYTEVEPDFDQGSYASGTDSWADDWDEDSWGKSPKTEEQPLKPKSKMDPSERHELVILTRAEAISGCRKTIEIDGSPLTIEIPPNFTPRDSMTFRGYGYRDSYTGERGVLKVQFLID